MDDSLLEVFEVTKFKPWARKSGNTFVPRDYGPPVYVKWRKENGRFVIDQIGVPES